MKKIYLIIILIILSLVSLFIGVKDINILDIIRLHDEKTKVFMISRVPRLISIIVTGASMAISGLIMQSISRNKFVSPSTAGTMEWCKLGVLVAIMIFPTAETMQKMIVAIIFSFLGTILFMNILGRIKFKDSVFIPLIGMMMGSVVSSITTFFAYKNDLIQNISSWLQGSFSLILKGRYELLYIGIPMVILSYMYASKFTIAGMGEDFSSNLGLNHKKILSVGLAICATITSVVVITVGTIPFIGIIIPNLISIYKGDNLNNSIFYTAIIGAIFVLICDILSRIIIFPYEIPIGVVVGVIGGAIFLLLILRRNAYEN